MNRLIILAVMLATAAGNQLSAQTIPPDSVVRIDKEKVKQCNDMIEYINHMKLRCKLLEFDHDLYITRSVYTYTIDFHLETVCFDKEDRLRQYFKRSEVYDGTHEYIRIWAYYDEKGDLIFLHYMDGCNCDNREESYWISEGKILDFASRYSCECCEDEEHEKEMNSRRPVLGSPLKNSIFFEDYSLEHFLRADTLLKALKKVENEE